MENNENEKIETKEEVKEMTVQENYSILGFTSEYLTFIYIFYNFISLIYKIFIKFFSYV